MIVLGLVGVVTLAWWLRTRAGCCAALPRGTPFAWCAARASPRPAGTDVEDAVTASRHDVPCVVLRLRDGRTTTIPVGVLAVDKEEFVREPQQRLQTSRGLKPVRAPVPRARVIRRPPRRACNLAPLILEASPSPVYGARLLSGFGATTPSRVQIPPPPQLVRPPLALRVGAGLGGQIWSEPVCVASAHGEVDPKLASPATGPNFPSRVVRTDVRPTSGGAGRM